MYVGKRTLLRKRKFSNEKPFWTRTKYLYIYVCTQALRDLYGTVNLFSCARTYTRACLSPIYYIVFNVDLYPARSEKDRVQSEVYTYIVYIFRRRLKHSAGCM